MVLFPNPACDFRGSKVLILLIHKMQVDYHNLLHSKKTTLTCKDLESTAVYLFTWTKALEWYEPCLLTHNISISTPWSPVTVLSENCKKKKSLPLNSTFSLLKYLDSGSTGNRNRLNKWFSMLLGCGTDDQIHHILR